MARRARTKPAIRIALGTREQPFASPWRFWTHGTSSYLAHRAVVSTFKASFHPATQDHPSATWTFGFTSESRQRFPETGSRRSHTWRQAAEFLPGWYRGPAIGTPRLPDRPYDLPPGQAEFGQAADVQWVDAPALGNSTFLMVFLSDDRPDLPTLEIARETE